MKFPTLSLATLLLLNNNKADGRELCSQQGIDDCTAEDRLCVVNDGEACGPCLDGFVEWKAQSKCLNIENLDIEGFLTEYTPVYKETQAQLAPADRLALLKAAALYISQYNAQNPDSKFELGLTSWSADTEEELAQRSGFFYKNVTGTEDEIPMIQMATIAAADLPKKVDWVTSDPKAVTSVKDQGRCGSCWAFSMVGAIEGAAALNPETNGYFQSLSWQQLISCNDSNDGCNGGSLVTALGYSWLNDFGGVARMSDYEYSDYKGDTTTECKVDDPNDSARPLAVSIEEPAIVLDFGAPFDFDLRLEVMKQAVAQQPVAMTIRSSCRTLSNYRKGIMTDDGDCACSSSSCIDHAILMVGYDDNSDPPSWKLKNSWGTGWGEDGYFRISQAEKGSYGLFGVLSHGVVPVVAYNVTEQVAEVEQDTPMERWAIILIIVASIVACMCVAGVIKKSMGGGDDGGAADDGEK